MNNYDKGVIYGEILESLKKYSVFIDKNKVESLVLAGATYLKRELEERYRIYSKAGPSLEGIVLTEKDPEKYLEPFVTGIAKSVDAAGQQRLCYGAVVAVYKAANDNSSKVVPLETLTRYTPYVEPVLNALRLFHNDEGSISIYNENVKHGHI